MGKHTPYGSITSAGGPNGTKGQQNSGLSVTGREYNKPNLSIGDTPSSPRMNKMRRAEMDAHRAAKAAEAFDKDPSVTEVLILGEKKVKF